MFFFRAYPNKLQMSILELFQSICFKACLRYSKDMKIDDTIGGDSHMSKITFLGAGSTVFAKNVLGDCLLTPALQGFEIALFDIDHERSAGFSEYAE